MNPTPIAAPGMSVGATEAEVKRFQNIQRLAGTEDALDDLLQSRSSVRAIEKAEAVAPTRYRIDKSDGGFWPYVVRCGDGTQVLYKGHLKTCQRVAQALTGAFLDGAFVAVNGVPPKPVADCSGTSPCGACPDTRACRKTGCIRQTEYISDAAAQSRKGGAK